MLEAAGMQLELTLVKLSDVRVHEKITPELLSELVREIKASGAARDPTIVDSDTHVVLDGMHRVAALREIGCRYLPVCLLDYSSPKVRVGCWYRVIRRETGKSKFLDIFKLLGLEVQPSPLEVALQALEERKATAALLTSRACHLLKAPRTEIGESYAWVKRIEHILREVDFSIEYENESDAERKVQAGEVVAALMVPRVRKEEVIDAARSGNVFAHKTTRHILPARLVGVNVPLEWLLGDRSLDEVNRALTESLLKRKLERLPKGSVFEGRRYEEELWVFE
jgi:hypothetical protein